MSMPTCEICQEYTPKGTICGSCRKYAKTNIKPEPLKNPYFKINAPVDTDKVTDDILNIIEDKPVVEKPSLSIEPTKAEIQGLNQQQIIDLYIRNAKKILSPIEFDAYLQGVGDGVSIMNYKEELK